MKFKGKLFASFLIFFLFYGCTYELENVTALDNLIPKEKFKIVLKDMMVAEQYYKLTYGNIRDYQDELFQVADSIFKIYGVDSASYQSSMKYYTVHESDLVDIYVEIREELEKK